MSSILNFSILKTLKSNTVQKSLKRLSTQNSKSYFLSNPVDQSKEGRSIRSKDHKSKGKEENYQSNRVIQNNIKYPSGGGKCSFVHIITAELKGAAKDSTVLTVKVLEKAIDQLFKFMKLILPKDIYGNIKAKFIEEVSKAITSTITQDDSSSSIFSLMKTPWSLGSSPLSEETAEKNLKLSYDFLPLEKDNQNRNHNNNLTSKKYNFNITHNQSKHSESGTCQSQMNSKVANCTSQTKQKLFNEKKHSLYSLTKGKNINQTRSNSKSQSNSKEHSSTLHKGAGTNSNLSLAKANIIYNIALNHKTINHSTVSKQFALGNAVTTSSNKASVKKSTNTKTQNLLNTKLFSKLQSDLLKMEISKCSIDKTQKNTNSKKCSFENVGKKEISKNHSLDKLTKISSLKQCTIEKAKLQSYRTDKEKEKEKEKSKSRVSHKHSTVKSNCSSHQEVKLKEVQEYQEKDSKDLKVKEGEKYIPKKKQKASNRKRDTFELFNETNEVKNSEQLKEIKSSLDDNLKVMFNFSYECFLNRESESESKMSYDDNTQRGAGGGEKNPKNSYSYKKKYKY